MTTNQEESRFIDRTDAGRRLAQRLLAYQDSDVVVYALPRGGVVLGIEIARELHAPLDLIIPRKIGHPSFPEYAIGAVAEDGHLTANQEELLSVDEQWLQREIKTQQAEARRRRETYLSNTHPVDVSGKVAIIIDDGIATGLTMRCAIAELKHRSPRKIIVAVPVSSADSLALINSFVDETICLLTVESLGAIGSYYNSFPQVGDAKVIKLMQSLPQS